MSRPTSLPAEWRPLVKAAGGVAQLTAALGLSARSSVVRYAAKEIRPRRPVLVLLEQFCQRHSLDLPPLKAGKK